MPSAGPAFFPKSPCHLEMRKIRSAGQGTASRGCTHEQETRSFRDRPSALLTVSCACQLPGVPRVMGFGSIPTAIPHNTGGRIEFAHLVPCVDSRFCFRLLTSSPQLPACPADRRRYDSSALAICRSASSGPRSSLLDAGTQSRQINSEPSTAGPLFLGLCLGASVAGYFRPTP